MIQLWQIVATLGLTCVVLLLCYFMTKRVLKKEMEKSLPQQLKTVRELFGEKDLEIIMKVNKDGKVSIEGFDIKEKIDYTG